MKVNNQVASNPIGFYEESKNFCKLPCRLTHFTRTNYQKYKEGLPFIQKISQMFQHLIPDAYEKQLEQYKNNKAILSKILGQNENQIRYMPHPSGSYNKDTLKILNALGIKLGFKQIMTLEPEKGMKKINNSNLEIARQDHADIMKMMIS